MDIRLQMLIFIHVLYYRTCHGDLSVSTIAPLDSRMDDDNDYYMSGSGADCDYNFDNMICNCSILDIQKECQLECDLAKCAVFYECTSNLKCQDKEIFTEKRDLESSSKEDMSITTPIVIGSVVTFLCIGTAVLGFIIWKLKKHQQENIYEGRATGVEVTEGTEMNHYESLRGGKHNYSNVPNTSVGKKRDTESQQNVENGSPESHLYEYISSARV